MDASREDAVRTRRGEDRRPATDDLRLVGEGYQGTGQQGETPAALSAVGNDGLRFSHIQCLLNMLEGKEGFGPTIGSF